MHAESLLLGATEVSRALGPQVFLETAREHGAVRAIGAVIQAAAESAAYRSFAGSVSAGEERRAVAVGQMALVFAGADVARNTFDQVAEAAHLRTTLGRCDVAVETVTAASGLVSYWGYIQGGTVILVITLDTLDPQTVSMTSFRALATLAAESLGRALDRQS